jgi:hypothetical protein
MMRNPRYLAFLATAALTIAGCGGPSDGLAHQAVSGEVTLDGQPLASGSIVFVPIGSEDTPTGGEIKDGSYAIPAKDGPMPVAHAVSVFAKKPTGLKLPDPNNADVVIEEKYEIIPPKYNVKTNLKAEIKEGGENRFDFMLTDAIKTPPSESRAKP